VRRLASEGCHVITVSRSEGDLRRQAAVESWLDAKRPDAIFLAAATVGGIYGGWPVPGGDHAVVVAVFGFVL
jgi:nucleoside-diphosphate-sugar epimerase